ncbi:hypothetical protein MAHJHV58_00030 [Mycobacterium avium subsp. hominissuis]|nr:hypothetical protein L838_0967 [Mycobacterium avium MAV_120709_2344]
MYAQPVAPNATAPQRIWTLTAGTQVKAICQSADPAFNFGINTYVSWAPGKFGFVSQGSVTSTSRTADTNELIDISELKGC